MKKKITGIISGVLIISVIILTAVLFWADKEAEPADHYETASDSGTEIMYPPAITEKQESESGKKTDVSLSVEREHTRRNEPYIDGEVVIISGVREENT